MIKKLGKNIILLSAFFVAIILISSSSMSMTLSNMSETKNSDLNEVEEKSDLVNQLTGLDPNRYVKNPSFNRESAKNPSRER